MVILGLTLKNILAAEVWPEHKNPGCYGGAGFKITCVLRGTGFSGWHTNMG